MFAKHLAAAIDGACLSQLHDLAKAIWKGQGAGLLTDDDAQGLAEAIEARRALAKASRAAEKPAPRRVGSRPRSAASLERRRRWVSAGLLPPPLACQFTMGEAAALAVVAIEVQKRGRCELTIGAIAGTAGVCPTTVRNALRQARHLGFLTIDERRLSWTRNRPNLVRIVAPEWTSWLRLGSDRGGGCKTVRPTPTHLSKRRFAPFEQPMRGINRRSKAPDLPDSQRARPPKTE